jgi:hypothetical protein
LNLQKLYYAFDTKEYHGIVLFSKAVLNEGSSIGEEQKQWLKHELETATKPCLIFVHHGVADQDLIGNPWFEGREKACLLADRQEIREIFVKSGKVVAVFNGHLHRNHFDIHDNIPYYTIQSFTENEGDKGIPSAAYAIVHINGNASQVEIKGNYPKTFMYTI